MLNDLLICSHSYNNESEYIQKDNDEEEQEVNNNIQLCTEVNKLFGKQGFYLVESYFIQSSNSNQYCKGESVQAYYQRVTIAYNDILKSSTTKGFYGLKPSTSKPICLDTSSPVFILDIYDVSRPMKSIAKSSWKMKELPGRNPLTQWPESLNDLNERLMSLSPMAAWSEPIPDVS